jgi:hypothetical protein
MPGAVLVLCLTATSCDQSSATSQGPTVTTSMRPPTQVGSPPASTGAYSLAATADATEQGGDSYTYQVEMARPVAASQLPDVANLVNGCVSGGAADPAHMLVLPVRITTTLHSSLPLKLWLHETYVSYFAKLTTGISCISGDSGAAVWTRLDSSGASSTQDIWIPLLTKITPNQPLGDPAELANEHIQVQLSAGSVGTSPGEQQHTYGPRVCNGGGLQIVQTHSKAAGCGTHPTVASAVES